MQKLNLVNGVIFTGGRVKDGLYFEVVKGIFQVLSPIGTLASSYATTAAFFCTCKISCMWLVNQHGIWKVVLAWTNSLFCTLKRISSVFFFSLMPRHILLIIIFWRVVFCLSMSEVVCYQQSLKMISWYCRKSWRRMMRVSISLFLPSAWVLNF